MPRLIYTTDDKIKQVMNSIRRKWTDLENRQIKQIKKDIRDGISHGLEEAAKQWNQNTYKISKSNHISNWANFLSENCV